MNKRTVIIGIFIATIATTLGWKTMAASNGSSHPLLHQRAPELSDGTWINSEPQTLAGLRGKVVLLEFWTYGCYNCKNTLPAIREWNDKFPHDDLVIIGIHTPEFGAEKDIDSVQSHVRDYGITYPVVTDNEFATWNAYQQEYWPVLYLIDRKGVIRYVRIGEGNYGETEKMIRSLIRERS